MGRRGGSREKLATQYTSPDGYELNTRHRQALILAACGFSRAEVAQNLDITRHWLRGLWVTIRKALGVRSDIEALVEAENKDLLYPITIREKESR